MRARACLGLDDLGTTVAAWRLPARLNAELGGQPEGFFDFDVPSDARDAAEARRDFFRTITAGGVALLTPALFEEVWRPSSGSDGDSIAEPAATHGAGGAAERPPLAGDVSLETVQERVMAFREQLFEVSSSHLHEGDDAGLGPAASPGAARDDGPNSQPDRELADAVLSGIVEVNLTVSPAMGFIDHVGLPPRILQPRFVVIVGPGCLRVATLGYVGEPVLGVRPSERRTPFVARLLTQNLAVCSPAQPLARIRVNYWVRSAGAMETSISPVLSAEVPSLLDIVSGRAASFANRPLEGTQPLLLVAGVALPADGVQEKGDVTLFAVQVTPADGAAPWTVHRRYQQFHQLYCTVQPASDRLVAVSFPRKRVRAVVGDRLDHRRRGLETWLSEVVREAQSREPAWLQPLREFLEVNGRG